MTPFEIALAIRNRPDTDEDLQAFVLRTMANEKITDLRSALEISVAWEHALDYFEALVDALRPVSAKMPQDAKVGALIEAKRNLGYDAKLESLLAHRWRCPHCKQFSTIDKVEVQIGGDLFRCVICKEEGIAPVDTQSHFNVRDGGKSGLRPL